MGSRSFVVAHLADAHVGAWPRAPAVRAALRQSVLRALEVVEEQDAEFLVISGDLFHTPVPDPAEVAPVASALTPVPGGVGPMTITMLLVNTVQAARQWATPRT